MNFSISKQQFNQAINTVSKSIIPNSPIPSLSGIKIDVLADRIKLTGSDSNLSIIQELLVDDEKNHLVINEEGSLIIDYRYLTEIVKKFEGDVVDFELIDGLYAQLTDKKSDFNINGLKASTYPMIDFTTPSSQFDLDADVLISLIDQTIYAVSTKETRPVLTGVNFHYLAAENLLTVIATDSYRLAQKKVILNNISEDFNITIPHKLLNDLKGILTGKETIKVALDSKKIQFILENLCVQSRLLDGLFPETKKLIPTEFVTEILINTRQFFNAVDRASFIKQDGTALAVLNITEKGIVMSNNAIDIGSYKEELLPIEMKGKNLKITFSCQFLKDALRTLHSNEAWIKFSGEMRPAVIVNPSDDSLTQLILPVRNYD